jgi:hypothetical protein
MAPRVLTPHPYMHTKQVGVVVGLVAVSLFFQSPLLQWFLSGVGRKVAEPVLKTTTMLSVGCVWVFSLSQSEM